ncbi:MAG: transcription termination factor Rho [Phycisphaerales bacterium]|nr:transcription termination factor Rho [Phycisphaerales bacterium]
MAKQAGNKHFTGILELNDKRSGYLRDPKRNYSVHPQDPQVTRDMVEKFRLRGGEPITSLVGIGKKGRGRPFVREIETIGEKKPDVYGEVGSFDDLPVVHPTEQLKFETGDGSMSMRIVDLFTPIGKGQRGLIVAPPRTGKTILLQQMAHGIRTNHPDVLLMMLLVDERPEEVTEMRRTVCKDGSGWQNGDPEVVYSSNDHEPKNHARIAELMIAKAKRFVETGRDVVILFDSLTRLGRAYNNLVGSSGRTMTGGLDIRALVTPKHIFGAARKIENGGSLTIIASVLIETGSRMDDFIFQEFKGTGNMELVLSRELANLRIWPAKNLAESGTRKEEMLLGEEACDKMARVRRRLLSMSPPQQMETILGELGKFDSNQKYLANLAS